MIKRKNLVKCTIVALAISLLIGMIFLTYDLLVSTYRNGEEYCDAFYDGQVFEQEFILNNTNELAIDILTLYQLPSESDGILYTFEYGEATSKGFVALRDLPNQRWTPIKIPADIFYNGPAKLTLQAVGLDQEDAVQFLITTNTLQKNAELTLKKDGQIIPNGRLTYRYLSWNLSKFMIAALVSFSVLFVLMFFQERIIIAIRNYPIVFLLSALYLATFIAHFSDLKNINKHVSAQYFLSWFDLGIVRRALAGTIIDLLNINFDVNTYIFYGVISIAIILVLELTLIYDKKFLDQRRNLEKCFFCYLCVSFLLPTLFHGHFFARLDQILIIVFLISCITVIKERGIWLVPIMSVLAILIHEMYLSSFIPFVFCILLYKWYITRQNKYMDCLIVTSVSSLASGIYVSFFAKVAIPFEEAWARIQATGDPELIWDFPLRVENYMSMDELKILNHTDILQYKIIPNAIVLGILFLPLILIVISWLKQFWKMQNCQLGKLIVLVLPCTAGGLLFSMSMMCDYSRLLILFTIGVFFTFLTLWSMDKRVWVATQVVYHSVQTRYGKNIFYVLFLFYLLISSFGFDLDAGRLVIFMT